MTTRLLVCLAVSAFIHALALVQPWNLFVSADAVERPSLSIPVRLVDEVEPTIPEIVHEDMVKDMDEGVNFEAEGTVSADYMELLKAKIFEAWEYPDDAVAMEAEGTVKLLFVLDGRGSVTEICILSTSGHKSLDTAAMDAVQKAGPFGPFTEDITGETLRITGSFCYVLD
ncbi:MAG TPA: TonB family protein [Deltaproteobacteria bacterium]|jgi:TonB family protein|nr:energy transducer TonB [Deltaproteobacteria bacterium]MDI9542571.1 TonB family protein [Pseudomonadota bacterium]HOD70826.1 TonB family protein [Deltaproteobacteria bacterium]HOE73138.1 TonB family protein [Deltaproteobacteria bacterium]HON62075.1 TonB family protein [Deltaproteobacteria bacterium]